MVIIGEAASPPPTLLSLAQALPPVGCPCSASRAKLDATLREWADWHATKYLPGYVAPDVSSGTIAFEPAMLSLAWEEVPAKPAVPSSEAGPAFLLAHDS
jgi:hypothetical protein